MASWNLFAQSAAGQLVEKATSELLLGPDWIIIFELVDYINSNNDGAKDAAKAIRKRFGKKNPKIALLALMVTEALVKNCGFNFHTFVGSSDFMNDMLKLLSHEGEENYKPVQRKVLCLVGSWASSFERMQDVLPVFTQTYQDLKAKGTTFPPMEAGAVFGRDGSASGNAAPPQETAAQSNASMSKLEKLKHDLGTVEENVNVLTGMIDASEKDKSPISQNELAVEVALTVREMKKRLVQLTGSIQDSTTLAEVVRVNELCEASLQRYEAGCSGNTAAAAAPTPADAAADTAATPAGGGGEDLVALAHTDAGAEEELTLNRKTKPQNLPPPPPVDTSSGNDSSNAPTSGQKNIEDDLNSLIGSVDSPVTLKKMDTNELDDLMNSVAGTTPSNDQPPSLL